jgi:hypothetical protein
MPASGFSARFATVFFLLAFQIPSNISFPFVLTSFFRCICADGQSCSVILVAFFVLRPDTRSNFCYRFPVAGLPFSSFLLELKKML